MLDACLLPMLAYSSRPFDSRRHLFEIKWDGTRCLMFIKDGGLRLQNRRLQDITARYPEFSGLPGEIRARNVILDGELVVLSQGRSDFPKLQQREQVSNPLKIELLSRALPATYLVFDILFLNDQEYVQAPLRERKKLMQEILPESVYLLESRYILEKGQAFFKEAVAQGLEGIMAKALDSPYLIGRRSRFWLKIKPQGLAACYILGFSEGQGGRRGLFGSLALATVEEGEWKYRGMVGSGFTDRDLEVITARLKELKLEAPAFPVKGGGPGITWVRPELRCQVAFQEKTARGHFRAPVFKGLIE
jgi:bifunctional non-homologous end joining protein LigD